MSILNMQSGIRDIRLSRLFLSAIILFLIFWSLSASAETKEQLADIQQTLAENQDKWQQSAIDAYRFELQTSCFCGPETTFPMDFGVSNNTVVSSQYDCSRFQFVQAEPICDSIPHSSLHQTVDSLFELIEDAINRDAESITVEYDPTYGFPAVISIDYIALAVDDEISYQIRDFKPDTSTPLMIKTFTGLINHRWQPIDGVVTSANEVVFYSAPSSVGPQRGVVRMRTAGSTPQFKFQEWSDLDGRHINEQLSAALLSKGRWDNSDYQLEVGSVEVSGTEQWITVNFSKPFKTPPQAAISLQTANGPDGVSARVRNITETSMQIQLVEEDAKKFSGHVTEIAGYLLIASPHSEVEVAGGHLIKLHTNNQPLMLSHLWKPVVTGLSFRVEEDQTQDNETVHVTEFAHLIQIDLAYLSQLVSDRGNDNAVIRASSDYIEEKIRKQAQIDNLVADLGCDSSEQCKEIAFGAKPCGGPWSFLTYSIRQTDETELTAVVSRYNELDRLQNEREAAVSDCSVSLPSFPVCSNNICMSGDQPPPEPTNAAQLTRFSSEQSLEKFLKDGLLNLEQSRFNPFQVGFGGFTPDSGFSSSPEFDFSPAPPSSPTSADNRFSDTNIQEQGVDEADFLKTDGNTLYVSDPDRKQIRILEMLSDPYRVKELATVETDADRQSLRGLYLLSKRNNQAPDVLTSIHAGYQQNGPVFNDSRFAPEPYYPWYWMNQLTEINVYDVSTPSQPQALKTISIEGSLVASRLIGESLYVVTHFVPNIQPKPLPVEPFPTQLAPPVGSTDTQQSADERIKQIEQASLEELLPNIAINGTGVNSKNNLVDITQAFLPPVPGDYKSSDLLTVSRFDLSDLNAAPKTTTLVGSADTIYVSNNALYVATSIYGYQQFNDVLITPPTDGSPFIDEVFIPSQTTQIHKISLTAEQPVYQGSTNIEGLITGTDEQRRFRFSELDNALRVVSTGQWGFMGEHRVTVLREHSSGNLQEISHLPNEQRPQRLGKPNERLFATRFVGTRLFLVTFQQIDPLIAVDLSDEKDPKLQGELEIPGFSDYLHPINENLLLGIGKHAVAANGPGDGRFAWFQGIRIGLFDISGTDGPKELDTLVIGERGSDSETLDDIHAFSFLPNNAQTSVAKFTIPIAVNGKTFPSLLPGNSQSFPSWSHSGLYMFEVDTSAAQPHLQNTGVIKVAENNNSNRDFNDMRIGSNRAVLLDDGVFFSHQSQIWSADWLTPEQAIGPQ